MSRRFLMMASITLNVALAGVGIGLVKRPVPGGPASPVLNIVTSRPARVEAAAEHAHASGGLERAGSVRLVAGRLHESRAVRRQLAGDRMPEGNHP